MITKIPKYGKFYIISKYNLTCCFYGICNQPRTKLLIVSLKHSQVSKDNYVLAGVFDYK